MVGDTEAVIGFVPRLLEKCRCEVLSITEGGEPATAPSTLTGEAGAYAYAVAHKDDFDGLRLLFNLDTIAQPGATKGVATQRRPESLRLALTAIGQAMGEPFPVDDHLSMYSDQFPFVLQGVPSAILTNPDAPHTGGRGVGHTTTDTLDKVDSKDLT